jgi:hypothetical protein
MAKAPVKKASDEIVITDLRTLDCDFWLLGLSPLLCNAMSLKSQLALLSPETQSRNTSAERARAFKHEPTAEFRDSINRMPVGSDTLIALPLTAVKKALATAALDIPGTRKAEIGRLISVATTGGPGGFGKVGVYGIPRLHMAVVRMADAAKTPDIRTRAMLDEWCVRITLKCVVPKLTQLTVARLLMAAGITCGVGDGRQEKGALSYGSFTVVEDDDPAVQKLISTASRAAQEKAMAEAEFADEDSAALYAMFVEARTGMAAMPEKVTKGRGKRANGAEDAAHVN